MGDLRKIFPAKPLPSKKSCNSNDHKNIHGLPQKIVLGQKSDGEITFNFCVTFNMEEVSPRS